MTIRLLPGLTVAAALLLNAAPALGQAPAATPAVPPAQAPVAPPPQPKADKELTAALERLRRGDVEGVRADLQRLAKGGGPGAQAMLDGFVALGIAGGRGDFAKACKRWEEAANVSAEAAHFTAECYEHGHGGSTRDIDRAVILYTRAAEGGYPKSWCALGNLHRAGKGVAKDPKKALAYCRKGADLNDPDAQADLGNFYLAGDIVPKDMAQARAWYEKAAAQGQKNAAYNLGLMLWHGDGVAKDTAGAVKWFKAAYEAGRRDASAMLGREAWARAQPGGGAIDRRALDEAIAWFELAVAVNPPLPDKAALEGLLQRARLVRGD